MPPGHVLAGADEGTWALVGALALRLGNPAVMVRRTPKTYFVSYGDDPNVGDGRLAGERLAGTPIHVVDDLVYAGTPLSAAVDACVESISPAPPLRRSCGLDERRHRKPRWKRAVSDR